MKDIKHEWRKQEKNLYLPKAKPEIVETPNHKFVAIRGEGNPNSPFFADYIGVLYAVSYENGTKEEGPYPRWIL